MKETSEAVLRQMGARYVHPLQPPRYRASTINTTRYTIRARPMTHISLPCNLIYSVLRIARPDNIARERKSHLNMHSAARRARELISRHGRHLAEKYFSVLPPCVSFKDPLTYTPINLSTRFLILICLCADSYFVLLSRVGQVNIRLSLAVEDNNRLRANASRFFR